jgi:hypothetical protein
VDIGRESEEIADAGRWRQVLRNEDGLLPGDVASQVVEPHAMEDRRAPVFKIGAGLSLI